MLNTQIPGGGKSCQICVFADFLSAREAARRNQRLLVEAMRREEIAEGSIEKNKRNEQTKRPRQSVDCPH